MTGDASCQGPSSRRHALIAILSVVPAGLLAGGCGDRDRRQGGHMPGSSMMPSSMMPPSMMGGGRADSAMMRDMPVIHQLLTRHRQISRSVQDIPGGIRATTTSTVPEVTGLIREHVEQMKQRLAEGDPIRQMDPLFREIFQHHAALSLQVTEVDGGVRIVETSPEPLVALLIRQHAHRAVSEFVTSGMPRAMRPTPLPAGYRG